MKRLLALLLTVSMLVLLPACQSESPQSGKDNADNILQEDVEQTDSENVQGEKEKFTVDRGKDNLSGTVPDELE